VSGKVPQLWDPKTGELAEILTYREENGQTIIPLHLEPEGSVFVVFKDAPAERHVTTILKDKKSLFPGNQFTTQETPYLDLFRKAGKVSVTIFIPGEYNLTWSDGKQEVLHTEKVQAEKELSGKWILYFDPKWGGPEKYETDELKSWIKSDNPGIKYYSGTVRYEKSFSLTPQEIKSKKLVLNLGNVHEMASVKINGHQMQVVWSAPFKFDINPFIMAGANKVEIEVVNMWPNRLIGDARLPVAERLTKTNINKFDQPDGEKYLRESGLLGPVKIISYFLVHDNKR
jgi:hypothetical protein